MDDNIITEVLTTTRHIALVGASEKPTRASHYVMAYLLGQGYKVTPVSPKLAGQTLLGQRVYAKLEEIPEPVDMLTCSVIRKRPGRGAGGDSYRCQIAVAAAGRH